MKLNITFPKDMPREKATLIVNTIALCKHSGYTISYTNRRLSQLYHSNITKDKADSIQSFLSKKAIEHRMVLQ
jgi:hypothetical protein